tara:strand:- start:3043 stop:3447 length:405 start_codon:yes stop_codon:yes gene_type:complete
LKIYFGKNPNNIVKINDITIPITIACHAAVSAFEFKPLPKDLEIEEVVAPPIAPADIICIKEVKGNTKAKLASGTIPNLPIKKASAKITSVIDETPIKLGNESLQTILKTGPLSITFNLSFTKENSSKIKTLII